MKPGVSAVRHTWPALLLIQGGALVLVLSYYRFEGLRGEASAIAEVKIRFGLAFAFAAGMMAGGIIPETAKLLTGGLRRFNRRWLADSAYNAFVYGIVGVQVDLFYRLQALMFGPNHDLRTLVLKTSVDMGAFSTIVSIPTASWLYAWKRNAFRTRGLAPAGVRAFYVEQVVPGLIPCWCFWIPVLFCTYSMPVNLQLPFSMLAEAAWSILFVFITRTMAGPTAETRTTGERCS